jgi:hypothetical protein
MGFRANFTLFSMICFSRQEADNLRLKEICVLREEWKILPYKSQFPNNWCSFDFSYQSIGATPSERGVAAVFQAPNSTTVQVFDRFLNRNLHFLILSEGEEGVESHNIEYIPDCGLSLAPEATGVDQISQLLENAQYSSLCSDVFSQLSREALQYTGRNIIRRKQEIQLKPTFSQTLTIRSAPLPANQAAQEELTELSQISQQRQKREWHFTLSMIHIMLFKLMQLKYQSNFYDNFVNLSAHRPKKDRINMLNCVSGFFAHLNFCKQINLMLDRLTKSFALSVDETSVTCVPYRSLRIHWVPTDSPVVSSVDVHLSER